MAYQGVIHRSMVLRVRETDQLEPLGTEPIPLLQTWTYVDNLTDTDPDASVYTTYADDRGFVHIVFGDNVAGRIPPVGAELHVTYRYGQGARGNVAPGAITLITPPVPSVSVNNFTAFQNGADNESIDSMRHGIPRASKLRDRAITLQDYADLCFQVPGVGKAVATGEFYSQIKVYVAPVGGGYPNADLMLAVSQYLQDRSLVGVTLEMHPFSTTDYIYTYVRVALTVHVLPQYGQLTVVNAVTQAIINVFSFDNPEIDFGALVSRGEVYHAALNVSGVDWIELTTLVPLDDSVPGNPIGTAAVQDIQAGPTRIPVSDAAAGHITVTGSGGLV
jgi:predicted phage baseplate assembly protein